MVVIVKEIGAIKNFDHDLKKSLEESIIVKSKRNFDSLTLLQSITEHKFSLDHFLDQLNRMTKADSSLHNNIF